MSDPFDPFDGLSIEEVLELIDRAEDPGAIDRIIEGIEGFMEWQPWPYQEPPAGRWSVWLFMGGRGTGKTDTSADWMDKHAQGPPCDPRLPGGHRMSIVAPTLGDAAESCVNGPSGLKAHNPAVRMTGSIGGTVVRWPNGAEAKLFGGWTASDVERFRAGGNRCACWIEEAAAIPKLEGVWEQIPFGHRLGANPQVMLSTTPKPRAVLKKLLEQAHAWLDKGRPEHAKRWDRVIVTRATTDMNPALDAEVREGLYDLYGGTRLAAQELQGELLEDFEGALWQRPRVEELWVPASDVPTLRQRWVGVDPSMWGIKALNDEREIPEGEIGRGVETGIVVSGSTAVREVYTVADYSKRWSANDWANKAIDAALKWKAGIVPETNAGGPLVVVNIRAAEAARKITHPDMPLVRIYKKGNREGVHASDGKRARAEPVSGLTEQGRHHFVDQGLELLIDQCCGWDPNEPWSPDRMDAMVWSVYALEPWRRSMVGTGAGALTGSTR